MDSHPTRPTTQVNKGTTQDTLVTRVTKVTTDSVADTTQDHKDTTQDTKVTRVTTQDTKATRDTTQDTKVSFRLLCV